MILTNRLWRAIAACFRTRETQAEVMVWAKIMTDDLGGKRHAFTEIALTEAQTAAVKRLLEDDPDQYVAFCARHECAHNPRAPWWVCS